MTFTKAALLQHSIAFALRSVRLHGRRLGLAEEARMRVATERSARCANTVNGANWMTPLPTATQFRIRMTELVSD
jgi:hypothetical protein